MYPFNNYFITQKKSKGINTKEYIIIHHTGGGIYHSNCTLLSGPKINPDSDKSTHFIIGPHEERAKIGEPSDILRHTGESKRGNIKQMNKYSLGIEVVGYGERNQWQFIALTDLVQYLMGTFNIPPENILRHADITQNDPFTKQKILRDGKGKSRKVDINDHFFPKGFKSWRDQLYPRNESRYKTVK